MVLGTHDGTGQRSKWLIECPVVHIGDGSGARHREGASVANPGPPIGLLNHIYTG